MAKISVNVLKQKVFHDGLSMVVLKPGDPDAEVDTAFVRELVNEGVIDEPDDFEDPDVGGLETGTPPPTIEQPSAADKGTLDRLASLEAWKAEAEPILAQVQEWKGQMDAARADAMAARDEFDPMDLDGDGQPGGSVKQDPPALTGKTKAELLEIAKAENVDANEEMTNKAIADAIEAGRAQAAGEAQAPA